MKEIVIIADMRQLIIFSFFLLYLVEVSAQTSKVVELANNFLKKGNHKAAITIYEFPDDIKELQSKAIRNLKADPEWAEKYIVRLVEKGVNDITYMNAYGLTQHEFDKMLAGFKRGKQAVFKDTFNLNIKRTNNIISFKGESKLASFDYLKIDTKTNQIIYDNFLMMKEYELRGKFYAPILYGYEAHGNIKLHNKKKETKTSSAGLSIGKNKGNDRTTMCLILTKPGKVVADFEFLTITLL